jgi:hypothetical protein
MAGRTVYIQRSSSSSVDPTWDIVGTGRHDEGTGTAKGLYSLRRDEVGDWLGRQGLPYSAVEEILNQMRNSDITEVHLPLRPGPRIVRTWLDTVINPLVQALQDEVILLERRNWTLASRPSRLELIRPVREHLSYESSENLDQLTRSVGDPLRDLIDRHDELAERLQHDVVSIHSLLAGNAEFRSLCDSLLSSERLADSGLRSEDVFGACPPEERYDLLAQYVVNSTGALSAHYSTAKFWNRNRQELLKTRDFPDVRERYSSLVDLGESLAKAADALMAALRDLRDQLSLEYDVPLATAR